ncbi:MAG TPA: DUF4268 domain-containing protein [Leptolyngbyaceae cyanobacterium M65_K2018_010]|nr:DUF4268 domain-containing protein [Leptolyngbyaceae cyanobacterium M65_K2018_010]
MRPKRTAKPKLGRLEKLHPADYWQSGADFQHWLTEAENLELLSEALELDLHPNRGFGSNQGVDYGLFQGTESNHLVLVAAQPGPAEATYLGQLITWAAREAASTVVWVAAEFAAAQGQALQWLNQLGEDRVEFIGVEVELWQIGKNAMAVNFKPLDSARPRDSSEADAAVVEQTEVVAEAEGIAEPEPLTEQQQENLDFWSGLCDRLDRLGSLVKPGSPSPEATLGFAIARAGFRLNTILDRDHQSLYTELLLSGVDAHPHFSLLAHERELIADEIGLPLIWDDSGEHTCVIASTLGEVDLADRDRWPDYQAWFCDCLERFYEAFFDRIKQLDAAGYSPLPQRSASSFPDGLILPASPRS